MSEEISTLGQRLDGQARRMAARAAPGAPWAAPFGVLLDHLTTLPAPADERFTRREIAVPEPAPAYHWPGEAAPSAGRPLPADVVTRLRTVVGPGVETMRVHDDGVADETARAHRADAVTIGADVFFRQGRLNPREPRGFGLLVHEATHVVERLRPGASWRQATAGGPRAEENLALTRESAIVSAPEPTPAVPDWHVPQVLPPTGQYPAATTVPAVAPGPAMIGQAAPAIPSAGGDFPVIHGPAPAARPMTAAVDRPTGAPPAGHQPLDVDALRGRIVRDLMRQLRDEFERGG